MGYSVKIKNSKIIPKESDIVRQICKYLQAKGEFFWRHNNVGVFSKKANAYLKPRYGIKGVPDIFWIKQKMFCAIEVKSESGKVSGDQENFRFQWESRGGKYLVVRSLLELINQKYISEVKVVAV